MSYRWFWKPKPIIFTSLVFALALLVARGSAAQPAAEQQDPVKETPKDVVVEKPAPKGVTIQKKDTQIVVPPTIVSGSVSRLAAAPAIALPQGKRGGFINMNDYADVRQRIIG